VSRRPPRVRSLPRQLNGLCAKLCPDMAPGIRFVLSFDFESLLNLFRKSARTRFRALWQARLTSPSPRPSPQRRGRIAFPSSANPQLLSASRVGLLVSLSLGERAGVSEKEPGLLRPTLKCIWLGFLICLATPYAHAAGSHAGNRLTYLDESDPFYVHRDFPKLTTPQWIGEPGVDAIVILAIDDMREIPKWENYLRPILTRLKQIDGRAPVSIMTVNIDPQLPHLQSRRLMYVMKKKEYHTTM